MICFDITDTESFRNVDNWLEEVKRYCPEQTPVFLVGTKSDLQSKRMVTYPTIKTYVERRALTYIETSSKTSENIENCFLDFTKMLVEHTNRVEFKHKEKSPLDLSQNPKSVKTGGCMGANTCII